MRSARIHRHGDPSVIRIDDVPRPVPGEGEVLVEVAATSFNPTETALRSGALQELFPIDLPAALGWDVAGTVAGRPVIGWLERGAAAEYAVAPAGRLVPAPTGIPLADAAAIPLAGLTAWQVVFPHVSAGQRVLVNGAGGGIGGFAVQLAKRAGAHVVATASARSVDAVRRHGADEIVDYTSESVASAVEPVDVLIHLVGAPPPWTPPVRRGGAIISAAAPVPAPPGVTSAHVVVRYDPAQLTELVDLVDAGVVTVDVTETHPLDGLADVHRRSEAGDLRGKVVILAR
ncbi:NADPH:quinone reductase [Amycolatopsis sp. NBRC 101858]|uniref:NADP-dependent oxidoreductase n=1 Tax=Amycolatopsis sp. NBRC 101858 TaxID=3032200 RepID=UPI0024A1BAFB|nr:NADP-dependent oxidoreductase [Amycolatopsis sp. NBRC 101858]GLY43342.1 NADPH:quinone reductase [Amycolatopsis sp. NBRC 101858]